MLHKIVSIATLLMFCNLTLGCTSQQKVLKEEVNDDPVETIVSVVMPSGQILQFDTEGGRYHSTSGMIEGSSVDGTPIQVPLADVLYVQIRKADAAKSIALTAGILAAGVLLMFGIIALTKESCPFVYSWDGTQYVFDAEPLGGAISRGLTRSDYSRLEHLKAVDGSYRLRVQNEVEETQHIDEMKLLVVDHPPSVTVVPDSTGRFYSVGERVSPARATDENGADLLPFIARQDGIAWQSRLPADTTWRPGRLWNELTVVFPRPAAARSARLVVNAGTTLWGSNMIREMLQLRGSQLDAWYRDIDSAGPQLPAMFSFIERDQLYLLSLNVREGNRWVRHGAIPGAGPLITEDRVLPLDLSGVTGDSVAFHLTPAFGFWSIDYMAIQYDSLPPPNVTVVPLDEAFADDGTPMTQALREGDGDYVVMPLRGDRFDVAFTAPPLREGMSRSVFLQTSGYYEIHLDKNRPPAIETMKLLADQPGASVQFALDAYQRWLSELHGVRRDSK